MPNPLGRTDRPCGEGASSLATARHESTTCGSELARDDGDPADMMLTDLTLSRASSLPQGYMLSQTYCLF